MSWHLVPLEHAAPQPWRNGGGVTRELLAWPQPAGWRVRISVADVAAAGPFSRFEGIERWFAVLEGAGVDLRIDGAPHRLTRESAPLRFDGAAAVDCTLVAGATRDFNLMAPPGRAVLRRVQGLEAVRLPGARLLALYAHARCAVVDLAGEAFDVPPFHLAWRPVDTAVSGNVASDDALWMEIEA